MTDLENLAGLFGSACLAATLIPAQSEALLFLLGRQAEIPAATLLIVASLGNIGIDRQMDTREELASL